MITKAGLSLVSSGSELGQFTAVMSIRLKVLRRERDLVERAIVALTKISQARESRDRRTTRH